MVYLGQNELMADLKVIMDNEFMEALIDRIVKCSFHKAV